MIVITCVSLNLLTKVLGNLFPFVILNCNHDLNQAWIYEFWTRREEQRRNSSDERKFVTFCWLFATLCNSLHQIPIINWDMFVNFFQTSSNCWISDWFQCRWCWWLQSGFLIDVIWYKFSSFHRLEFQLFSFSLSILHRLFKWCIASRFADQSQERWQKRRDGSKVGLISHVAVFPTKNKYFNF